MFLTWAIILEPDTNVSEGVMNQMSYHLKHICGVKISGNFSASEILMSLTWAIIVEPTLTFLRVKSIKYHSICSIYVEQRYLEKLVLQKF